MQTGAADSIAHHPIGLLTRLRFRVTVNTDNRLMSGTSMSREMGLLVSELGWTLEDLRWATINAMKSAFIPFDERLALIDEVIKPGYAALAWAPEPCSSHPALGRSLDRAQGQRPAGRRQGCGGVVVCRGRAERHPDQLRGTERPGPRCPRARRGGRRGGPPRLAGTGAVARSARRAPAGRTRPREVFLLVDGPGFQFVVPCRPDQLARARSFAAAVCAAGARPADAPIRRGAGPGFPRSAIARPAPNQPLAGTRVQPRNQPTNAPG